MKIEREKLLLSAEKHLKKLCVEITDRSVGSPGNSAANQYFTDVATENILSVTATVFDCIDWKDSGSVLRLNGKDFPVLTSPYSLPAKLRKELIPVQSIEELKEKEIYDKIVLLYGEIAKEQIMPKSFPWYNPEHHQEIVRLLEEKKPEAIIAVTSRDPQLAGGMYPFPLFEDGDFDIPSVCIKDDFREALLTECGKEAELIIGSERIYTKSSNIVATSANPAEKRIILTAHIDAKKGSPGAIDNATGVTVLLLLSQLLKGYNGKYRIELVPFNGEDYYSTPGQKVYLQRNNDDFKDAYLVINLDGVGYLPEKTAFSFYNTDKEKENPLRAAFAEYSSITENEQWMNGDHAIFAMMGIPTMAITSTNMMEQISLEITHNPRDNHTIVDYAKLVDISLALYEGIINS